MYEIGKVYIWQRQTGRSALHNGCETIVTGAPVSMRCLQTGEIVMLQKTDTASLFYPGIFRGAAAGELRLKNPPSGEKMIRDLFTKSRIGQVLREVDAAIRKLGPTGEQSVLDQFIRTPTAEQWAAFHSEGLVEEWRAANPAIVAFWERQPMQTFNCRCVPMPISKPGAA